MYTLNNFKIEDGYKNGSGTIFEFTLEDLLKDYIEEKGLFINPDNTRKTELMFTDTGNLRCIETDQTIKELDFNYPLNITLNDFTDDHPIKSVTIYFSEDRRKCMIIPTKYFNTRTTPNMIIISKHLDTVDENGCIGLTIYINDFFIELGDTPDNFNSDNPITDNLIGALSNITIRIERA